MSIIVIVPPNKVVQVLQQANQPPTVVQTGSTVNYYFEEFFIKQLSGFSEVITQTEHGLSVVRGLRVCKPTGELVEVAESYSGTTVQIDSNILLDNHILTLY